MTFSRVTVISTCPHLSPEHCLPNPSHHLRDLARQFDRQSRLFEQIATATPDFIYVFDLDGRFTYANRRLLEVWGRSFADSVGKNLYELGYPTWHADMHMRELRQVIETKQPVKGEVHFTGGSGISGIYEYIFTPVLGPDGAVEAIAGTTRDVTDRKAAERDVAHAKAHAEASLARWQAVVADMAEGVVVADAEGNLREWNAAALEMHGYRSLDEIRQQLRDWSDILELTTADGRIVPLADWPMSRTLRGESFSGFEVTIRRLDADLRRVISYSGRPVRDRDDRIAYAVLTLHDVTDRRRAEQELRRAKEEAERASRAKDQFLAVLSHELRTPLTPVLLSVAGMEAEPGLPPQVREELAMIRQSIALETRLIDDLLDLSRVANGKMVLHPQVLAVHPLIGSVGDLLASEFKDKHVAVRWDLAAPHDRVTGDSARLHQVFWNLLKNAIKFTPTGGTVTVRTTNPVPGRLRVDVADTGVGIDAATLPRVFDAFEQGEHAANRQFGGLGLGLAISKAIVDMHGGHIAVSSGGKGTGATFSVQLSTAGLPSGAAAGHPGGASRGHAPAAAPLRLLLVEDNEPTLRTLRRLLEKSGHAVTPAMTVATALAAVDAEPFDLLISDIGLPDGTGLDLMRTIRASGSTLPGIALTGFGMDSDVQNSLAAGFAAHLTKPIDLARLEATIRQVLARD